ncbi:hypothetical protein GCM10025759_33620 [Lysobacter panacisoli]|uniref:Uncharacterized protein n=1 Tax=Lysobacter panacisoli TaxID=1255263 RepID=A0ABP9LSN5_9GAMM
MTRWMRISWAILAVLAAVVAFGAIAQHIASRSVEAPLRLTPGASATLLLDRPVRDRVRLSLDFARPTRAAQRPELGDFSARKTNNELRFANPGERILLRVEEPGGTSVYEVLPAGGYSRDSISRNAVRFIDDGDDHRFAWPPVLSPRSIPVGRSTLKVTVIETGSAIAGENVILQAEPPLGFKRVAEGYDWLVWFWLWPVYAVVLGIAGLVLLRKTFRRSRTRTLILTIATHG